jgi:glycosyltransferase involved in cell wall biosynthesis
LANSFANRGYKIDMVLLSARGEFLDELHPDVKVIDLQIKRLRETLIPLVSYLRRVQPDAVLANMWPLTSIALWGRTLARVPTRVVVAEHTTWSGDPIARSVLGLWKVKTTMHLTFPKADGIVAVSLGAADDLARLAGVKRDSITVIYNPVTGRKSRPVSVPMAPLNWWSGKHLRLLAVGNLIPIKDYSTLLAAFALLRQRVDAQLLILGEGNCRNELEAQATKLGIEGSLYMLGFVKDPSPYYHRADLHILSSAGEGFGNVIVEALAAGTPVVSTDCPSGPREILCNGKFGRLVPVGDASKMAWAMAESLATAPDRLALKARAQDFSIDKAVDKYEDLLFPIRGIH